MPEPLSSNPFVLRHRLRQYFLRAAEALADERRTDDEAFAIARNTGATVLTAVDSVGLAAVDHAA